MNLSVISLGWRGNLTLVMVGFPLPTFPGSTGGFCRLNMKSGISGGRGFTGDHFYVHCSWLSCFHTGMERELTALRAVGLRYVLFGWHSVEIFSGNVLGWFTLSEVPHSTHHSLLSYRRSFYLFTLCPWPLMALSSNLK